MAATSELDATICAVIVLHAVWSPRLGVCLWGERSSARADDRDRPRGRGVGLRRHPFAADADELFDALGRLGVLGGTGALADTTLPLGLPSWDDEPEASPQLLRGVGDDARPGPLAFVLWEVDAVVLPAADAVALLLAVPADPPVGLAVGDSVRHLAEVCKLALELVARARVRPSLERRGERLTGQ